MGKLSILGKIKNIIGKIAWKVLLWSCSMTAEEYHNAYMDQCLDGKML